jgi:hypothetical protein
MLSCGCCEARLLDKEPIEDGPCTGKAKKAKAKPTKSRCPVNRTHEWYRERITKIYPVFWGSGSYDRVYEVSTCIHCWETKERLVREPWASTATLVLPKREVKF